MGTCFTYMCAFVAGGSGRVSDFEGRRIFAATKRMEVCMRMVSEVGSGYYIYMLILQALFRFNTSKSIRIFYVSKYLKNNLFMYIVR